MTSSGFVLRVGAYHGAPVVVSGIPTRAGVVIDVPIVASRVVNDPTTGAGLVTDLGSSDPSGYDIDALVDDFEDEYGCKVNVEVADDTSIGDRCIVELDVFEPPWDDDDEAMGVIDDLARRVTDWVEGFPSGR